MDNSKVEEIKKKFSEWWAFLVKKSDEDDIAGMGRERIIVFIVAFILALCLWLMVNLSRDFNLNIELPINIGTVPADKALVEELPETATVSVSGEGWTLINLYNNPPSINIDVNDEEVNLHDQVQQQMNIVASIEIQKVQPLVLDVNLEDRVSKMVPVLPNVETSFRDQYDFVDSAEVNPDSVSLSGAASLLQDIEEWPTDSVHIEDVASNVSQSIPLQDPGALLELSPDEVTYTASVAQYTEGEARVNINTQNFPQGRMVSFSPSTITVKYDVPIDEYTELEDENPEDLFNVYVDYGQIVEDSSGFLTPKIEVSTDEYNIKVRSFQPRRIAYFMILGNGSD